MNDTQTNLQHRRRQETKTCFGSVPIRVTKHSPYVSIYLCVQNVGQKKRAPLEFPFPIPVVKYDYKFQVLFVLFGCFSPQGCLAKVRENPAQQKSTELWRRHLGVRGMVATIYFVSWGVCRKQDLLLSFFLSRVNLHGCWMLLVRKK